MGNLVKLKIEAYKEPACTGTALGSIDVLINPEGYSRSYNVNYQPSRETNSSASTLIFSGIGQNDLDIKLVVDGTGVVPLPGARDADDYIKKLKDLVYAYQGEEHRPNYLKLTWGKLEFKGICLSLTISYSLFKPGGEALRATVNMKLSESTDYKTKAKEAKKSSPDLTHLRTVKAGDTLPLMTYRIYGDSAYYLEVARANNLHSLSSIKPGDRLYFPPIKK